MCQGCYEEFGKPAIFNVNTIAGAALIARVYEHSCVGGNLHCELDDWNLEDEWFQDAEMRVFRPEASSAQLVIERECWAALKAMTFDERVSALAIERGYLRFEINP